MQKRTDSTAQPKKSQKSPAVIWSVSTASHAVGLQPMPRLVPRSLAMLVARKKGEHGATQGWSSLDGANISTWRI